MHIFFILAILSFINPNNTVHPVWNVSAGGDSLPSSAGFSTGQYWEYDSPQNVFDGNLNTQMCSYGMCNMSVGSNNCGQNTGLYITAQRGAFVLGSFRFGSATWNPSRDPFIITIEGSNNNGSALTLGLSWTLIYNGTAGLSTDPGRSTLGTTQMINNNALAFASYRFLIVAKRGYETCAAISEIQLFGH